MRPEINSIWKHLKTGREYAVIVLAEMESDETEVVVYERHGCYDGHIWVRPLSEFMDGRFQRLR